MPGPDAIKRLIGRDIDVDERDGRHHHGRLVNVNRSSVWLVEGDEDCIIPLHHVADLRAS